MIAPLVTNTNTILLEQSKKIPKSDIRTISLQATKNIMSLQNNQYFHYLGSLTRNTQVSARISWESGSSVWWSAVFIWNIWRKTRYDIHLICLFDHQQFLLETFEEKNKAWHPIDLPVWWSAGASFIGYGGGAVVLELDIGIRSCQRLSISRSIEHEQTWTKPELIFCT